MLSRRNSFLLSITLVALSLVWQVAPAPASSTPYEKLKDSRDALLIQQREIMRSFKETQDQMDELRKRQTILEGYLHQIDRSIREVDGAMTLVH